MATAKKEKGQTVALVLEGDMVDWLDKKTAKVRVNRSWVARDVFRRAMELETDNGKKDFLDEIGEDFVKDYFNLVTPEDLEAR